MWRAVEGCGRVWTGVEGCGGVWRGVEGCGGVWRGVEGCGGLWRGVEGYGGLWRAVEVCDQCQEPFFGGWQGEALTAQAHAMTLRHASSGGGRLVQGSVQWVALSIWRREGVGAL